MAGCAGRAPIGSVVGGECRLVSTPEYAVRGKTNYDQRWVNVTSESLVRGCGQPRPKARPTSFDQPVTATRRGRPAIRPTEPMAITPSVYQERVVPTPRARPANPVVKPTKAKPPVKKRRPWWRRSDANSATA